MRNIGNLYERGQGVAKDCAKAREWYGKAAVSDHTGITVQTLRRYRNQNTGPLSFRIAGRGVVYARQAVDEWIAAQMASTVRGGH